MQSLAAPSKDQLSRGRLARFSATVVAGTVGAVLATVLSIGSSSLIVANNLSSFAPLLIGPALLSAVIMTLVIALASPMRAAIVPVQEIPCVAMGAIVGGISGGVATIDGDVQLTLMAALALATLITGVSLVVLGVFRLGEIVRFVPYPVIGGFLAGTGWMILLGGLGLVLAVPANITLFTSMPEPGALIRLGAAGVFVLCLVMARRRYPSPTVLPLVVLSAIGLFNAVVLLADLSPEDLHAGGWLVNLPEGSGLPWERGTDIFKVVDWSAVVVSMVGVPVLIVLTTLGVLLNATSVELERQEDVDLDRELTATGSGNALAGLAGGLPGFQAVSLTLLATRLGAENRAVGVVAAALMLAVFLVGIDILDIFPTVIIGGLLIWLGGSLMVDWLLLRTRRIARWDIAIIVLIFAVIVIIGFAEGVAAGLIAAALLFAYQYAQVDLVRDEMLGHEYRGSLVGSTLPSDWIEQYGKAILIVRLQGFLFFGTANRLRHHIQERIRRPGAGGGPGFLIIDFHRVSGIDSSALAGFRRLEQIAVRAGVRIVAAGLNSSQRALFKSDRVGDEASSLHFEPDLESGVTWCEQALLAGTAGKLEATESRQLAVMLDDLVHDSTAAAAIGRYCRRVVVGAGETLVAQGDPSNELYFIESGHASVETSEERLAAPVQLANVGAGDVVGEITFYLGDRRSASVIAKDELVAWQLSSEAMAKLWAEAPEAALRLHKGMAAMLSRRLSHANRYIRRSAD